MDKELEPFEAADMNEVVRLRKVEKAAKRLTDFLMPIHNPIYVGGSHFTRLLENLRKALQGD